MSLPQPKTLAGRRADTRKTEEVAAPDPGQRVDVQILGQRMLLKSGDDPRHVERLVTYVKRKIDEASAHGPVNSSKLAVLAALNIADDYFRALDEAREFKRAVAERSREMLRELDD